MGGENKNWLREYFLWEKDYRKYNLQYGEWCQYGFRTLTEIEKDEFISISDMQRIYRKYGDPDVREYFRNKCTFLMKYQNYVSRKWIYIENQTENEYIEPFFKCDCIIKPLDGCCGRGIKKINKDTFSILDIDDFKLKYNGCLVEEIVIGHKELEKFHPNSLNTIRVVTFSNGKDVSIIGAFFRMGNKGVKWYTNFGHGGVNF